MADVEMLESEVRQAEARLSAARAALAAATRPELVDVAVQLHRMRCKHNHTDGCQWEYEGGDSAQRGQWAASRHAEFLQHAVNFESLLGVMSRPDVGKVTLRQALVALRAYREQAGAMS